MRKSQTENNKKAIGLIKKIDPLLAEAIEDIVRLKTSREGYGRVLIYIAKHEVKEFSTTISKRKNKDEPKLGLDK